MPACGHETPGRQQNPRKACSKHCDFAACTAVPDGQSARNLERLGFQLLYTQTVLTQP